MHNTSKQKKAGASNLRKCGHLTTAPSQERSAHEHPIHRASHPLARRLRIRPNRHTAAAARRARRGVLPAHHAFHAYSKPRFCACFTARATASTNPGCMACTGGGTGVWGADTAGSTIPNHERSQRRSALDGHTRCQNNGLRFKYTRSTSASSGLSTISACESGRSGLVGRSKPACRNSSSLCYTTHSTLRRNGKGWWAVGGGIGGGGQLGHRLAGEGGGKQVNQGDALTVAWLFALASQQTTDHWLRYARGLPNLFLRTAIIHE